MDSSSHLDNNNHSNNHHDDSHVCWICHDKTGVLQTNFCLCSGSLGHVHQSCLQTFVDSLEGGGHEKDHCPTCKRKYRFVFFSKDGKEPPALPQTTADHAWFFFARFLFPVIIEYFVALCELAVNWLCPAVLIGTALFLGRGIATDFWKSHENSSSSSSQTENTNNNAHHYHFYDYGKSYMDQSVFDAMLVGVIMLGLKRRIGSGWSQIVSATTPNIGAPVAPMMMMNGDEERQQDENNNVNNVDGRQQQQQQREEGNEENFPNNGEDLQREQERIRNLEDVNAFVREDDEEEEDGDEVEEEEENEDDEQQQQQQQRDEERAGANANDEDVENQANNNNNNNNRRGRGRGARRHRRKGGNTFDQLTWKGVEVLQAAARYPHSDALVAYDATLQQDTPFLILTMLFFGLTPIGYCLYHAAWVLYTRVTKIPPKLKDVKNRYEEAGRRLKNESTQDDRERYYHIYCFDAIFLYLMLPLVCGIVAHESLGRTNFTQNETLRRQVLTQFLNESTSISTSYEYLDSLFNPWTIFIQGILPRFFNVLHNPWNALFHWIFGYVLAGAITAVESQIVTPVFAPGCNLVYFRAIHLSDELATFRFMLIQLFDVNVIDGISHCAKLFATYCPFILATGWLAANSLRLSIVWGYIIHTHIDRYIDDIVHFVVAVFDGSINDRIAEGGARVSLRDVVDFGFTALRFIQHEFGERALAIIAACPSPAVGDWGVVWPSSASSTSVPNSFWLSIALIIIALSAFYFLPFQFLVIRRFLPLAKLLARALSLEAFLFDPVQLANVDHFIEVSSSLPVRSDNVVELPALHVPPHQTAIRRERFIDASKVPRLHQVRVFVFVHLLLLKGFVDWILEVCLQRVLVFSLVGATIRGALYDFSAPTLSFSEAFWKVWGFVTPFDFRLVRALFDPTIYCLKVLAYLSGIEVVDDMATGLGKLIDAWLGPSPFFEAWRNSSEEPGAAAIITESIVTILNQTLFLNESDNSSSCDAMMMNFTNITNNATRNHDDDDLQSPFILVGAWLVAISLFLALIRYPNELAMATGYLLIVPVAIILFVAEYFKPAWENWGGTIESIWRTVYAVRRVIVPNPVNNETTSATTKTTTTKKVVEERSNNNNNNNNNNDNDEIETAKRKFIADAMERAGILNADRDHLLALLDEMVTHNNDPQAAAATAEQQHRMMERERQLREDLEHNGMVDPDLEEQDASRHATAVRQWLENQQRNEEEEE